MTVLAHREGDRVDHLVYGDLAGNVGALGGWWALAVGDDRAASYCGRVLEAGELVYRPGSSTSTCTACLYAYRASLPAQPALIGPERSEGPYLAPLTLPLQTESAGEPGPPAACTPDTSPAQKPFPTSKWGALAVGGESPEPVAAARAAGYGGRRTARAAA